MIILRTPKGWTGPKFVDGKPVEGTWRAHQVPIADFKNPQHLKQLEEWMLSYKPRELFDQSGKFREDLAALAPTGHSRMGSNPHANGGELLKPLSMPHFHEYAVALPEPGGVRAEATRVLGTFLRDVMKANLGTQNFRLFGPDETASNRLEAVYQVSGKEWMAAVEDVDTDLSENGRVMEVLSEHLCEGWLEGYLLTGRHGLFSCYEAFIHVIDSMFNQHAKWLKVSRTIPLAQTDRVSELFAHVACLAAGPQRLLASGSRLHRPCREQEVRCRAHLLTTGCELPPLRRRSLLAQPQLCQPDRRRQAARVAVARHRVSHTPLHRWCGYLALGEQRCGDPDVVMACAGDIPTLETLAAVTLLRTHYPDIRIRVVNVVDLMVLQPQSEHPHGMEDQDFDELFTRDKPVIFAFHGYPAIIHKLTYRRYNHDKHSRPRLQGRRHDHDAVRYGGAEQSGPFPASSRCDKAHSPI